MYVKIKKESGVGWGVGSGVGVWVDLNKELKIEN